MRRFPLVFYLIIRFVLKFILAIYLDFKYRFKEPVPSGPKIYVANHPTVLDVFPGIILFKNDIIHTFIEDRIWSLPLLNLVMSITNQVKLYRGKPSVRSFHNALFWLAQGHALALAPEGERTSVTDTRTANRGVIWLAVKARVPVIPIGIWISEKHIYMKKVRYHSKNRHYSADSYLPRFRAKYNMVIGKAIHFDQYSDKKMSSKKRQELSRRILNTIYQLKQEARTICFQSKSL